MAKATKPVALMTKKISKEERERRQRAEDELKGKDDKISKPPTWLTKGAKKIYRDLVKELEYSKVLCNLDIYTLAIYCASIDDYRRYEIMKQTITDLDDLEKIERLLSKAEARIKTRERSLGLDPSARAKIAQMNIQQKEEKEDPLLKLLAMREK